MGRLRGQLGSALRILRENTARLTQEKFANSIDMDASFIGEIERAEKACSIDTLERLAAGLNMPAWEVVRTAEVGPDLATKEPTLRPSPASPRTLAVLVVVEPTADGFSARAPDFPDCAGYGVSREAAEEAVRAAIANQVEQFRAAGTAVPKPASYAKVLEIPF